ncbi:MAG TPA: ABC transporter ATP-binding protein [Alphaproteobacteria bacterium]|nr:ABC transporter ATP-binding protein [Alphaproteobacteria bacterium]
MLLEADRLTVSVRLGQSEVEALREISFSLDRGRVLGLVGESGTGKTMIGRVIARFLPPGFRVSAGALRFGGEDLLALPASAHRALLGDRIAFIPQEPLTALNPVLTIGQQFAEHLARLGVPRSQRRDRAAAALAEVRLDDPTSLLDRYPFQLSGGMCQRVLIAVAFASNPALIVADEPTTALDVTTQAHIVTLIRGLQAARGTAMLFITHDLRLAAHLCDEALVLYAGDVVERGPASAVFTSPHHPYTRALKRANPPLSGPRQPLIALPDTMPGLASLGALPGCRFAPRCPTADAACARAVPPLREVDPGHWARCAPACQLASSGDAPAAPPLATPSRAAAAHPVLEFDHVSKRFRGQRRWFRRTAPVDAVRGTSLAVMPGEFVGVVGESGSGKSTLARLAMGLEAPSSGRIRLDGEDATQPRSSWSRRIATMQMIFQDPLSALNPRRRIESLVTQALEARHGHLPRAKRQQRAVELLRDVGLAAELAPRFPPQLSGGQRQRVNIARALCLAPRLLIADEIVSGLDVSVQAQILNLLLRLREEHGIALLFISHDLSVVRYLCDRVLVMYRGEIVETGATARVFDSPGHPYTKALLAAVPPDDASRDWPPRT